MSDLLVLEFYEGLPASEPDAIVLALYGGNSPDSAAETLADFFLLVGDGRAVDWRNASALATKFIVTQQQMHGGCFDLDGVGAVPIHRRPAYEHQLVRIRGGERGPIVEFVQDTYTKPEEIALARYILQDIATHVFCSLN